jgi:integrase
MTSNQRTPTRRENFTKKLIESLDLPESGRITVYDSSTPHLGLRLEVNGNKSFFWFRKVRGVPTFRAIGPHPDVSIDKARETAEEWNGNLAEWKRHNYEGGNPFEKPGEEPNFAELGEQYISRHVRRHAKRPDVAEKRVRDQMDFYLKDWKSRKLSAIRRADVLTLHSTLGEKHKYSANRTVQLVRLLFNFAVSAELWQGQNPAGKIKRFAEPPRERFLNHEELSRLFTALKNEPSADLRDFVNLSLWTGARKSDVFSARWENISFEDRRWTIPDPKRKPYAVPITVEAEAILCARVKNRRNNSPWVFPSHGPAGHVVDLKSRWAALLKRASITDFRIHDLRRTQGSWSAANGVPLQVIGKSLGHASTASTEIYARLALDPVREAMTRTNAAMLAASKRKPKQLAGVSRG